MGFARHAPVGLAVLAAFAIGCNRAEPQLTPEAASAKGDALLREMSKNMAAVQTFAYVADERREQVGAGGAKTERKASRKVIVRRPNGLTFTGTGDSAGTAAWYNGKHITLVSDKNKVWARRRCRRRSTKRWTSWARNTQCGSRPLICCIPPPTTR